MSNHTIATLEADIIDMIKAAVPDAKLVTSYSGTAVAAIRDGTGFNLPAILIELDRMDYEPAVGYGLLPAEYHKTYSFNVYVVTTNLRTPQKQRTRADKGAYAIVEDVETILLGKRIVPTTGGVAGEALAGLQPIDFKEVVQIASESLDKVIFQITLQFVNQWSVQ